MGVISRRWNGKKRLSHFVWLRAHALKKKLWPILQTSCYVNAWDEFVLSSLRKLSIESIFVNIKILKTSGQVDRRYFLRQKIFAFWLQLRHANQLFLCRTIQGHPYATQQSSHLPWGMCVSVDLVLLCYAFACVLLQIRLVPMPYVFIFLAAVSLSLFSLSFILTMLTARDVLE